MPRRSAAHVIPILACLILGAAAQVSVAWVPLTKPEIRQFTVLRYEETTPSEWPIPTTKELAPPVYQDRHSTWWMTTTRFSSSTSTATNSLHGDAFGWHINPFMWETSVGVPFRSMRSVQSHSGPRPARPVNYYTLDLNLPLLGQLSLPTKPIWPGFTLNTLLYAACIYALWRTPLALRRQYRRRHHRCTNCNYDRTGLPPNSPCPECGRPD